MDQSLLSLVAGKHTAGEENNISPEKIPYHDLSQIYHNYFLSTAFQFPYIPSYHFPNNIYLDHNINIGDDYCSLTNQTFKKPRPEPEITPYQYVTPTLVLNDELPCLDYPHSLEHVSTNPSLNNYNNEATDQPTPVQKGKQTQESNRVRVNKEKLRIRRKKISDKTMHLKSLLPSREKKMEMATVYAEASKYIKYLKAQIKVLEAMPVGDNHGFNGSCSGSGSNFGCDDEDGCGGKLRKLKRSELLEVLVNSKSAQRMMCSIGFCVYSVEQKLLLDDNHLLSTHPSFYF